MAGHQQGGPPPDLLTRHAHARIADARAKHFFTSDLSINEFLLVKEAGFDPLGLVMGTSIYQIVPVAPDLPKGTPGCELYEVTRSLYHARDLAMSRIEQEADELGADGIVGVRLLVNINADPMRVLWKQYQQWQDWAHKLGYPRRITNLGNDWYRTWQNVAWKQWGQYCQQQGWGAQPPPWARPPEHATYSIGQNVTEFLAIGTAVKHRGGGKSFKNAKGKPFQSDLNGQEFWMLIRAGYRPVGFVMGNCVYYVPKDLLVPTRRRDNCELSAYTHALYDARELAIERLQAEAEALGAVGIVDVTVSEHSHAWRQTFVNIGNAALQSGEMLELFVIGTAVVPMEGEGSGAAARPELIYTLNDMRADAPIVHAEGIEEE
jgi:uncharacterized protein YbjQ (UPF0145 family)